MPPSCDDFVERVVAQLDDRCFYQFDPEHARIDSYGSCIVPRLAFNDIGGYDEAIEGWGEEDDDLYFRLVHAGLEVKYLPQSLIDYVSAHSDTLRTRYHVENIDVSVIRNITYRIAKGAMINLSEGGNLEISIRHELFKRSHEAVVRARNSNAAKGTIRVDVPLRDPWVRNCIKKQTVELEIDASWSFSSRDRG